MTVTAIGITGPTGSPNISGTVTAQPALTNATRMYLRVTNSATTSGTLSGLSGPFTLTRPPYRPELNGVLYIDGITNRRVWLAIASAALTNQTMADTGATALTFVGVGFDTSVSPGNVWRCCSGAGSTATCVTVPGSSVVVNTEYTLIVDWSVAGTLTCSVQAGSAAPSTVSKTDNLSTATSVDLGIFAGSTNLSAGSTTNLNTNTIALEQN